MVSRGTFQPKQLSDSVVLWYERNILDFQFFTFIINLTFCPLSTAWILSVMSVLHFELFKYRYTVKKCYFTHCVEFETRVNYSYLRTQRYALRI